MRIPLDYYRILGLPIQATADQLEQAHRDRTRQLPRREYSESAIAARRALLDAAYAVLSDPEQRQGYDASFLAKTYDLDADKLADPAAIAPAFSAASPHTPETVDNKTISFPRSRRTGDAPGGGGEAAADPIDPRFEDKVTELGEFRKGAAERSRSQSRVEFPLDPNAPSIDIQEHHLAGALLILLELGEYELVLKLGNIWLNSWNNGTSASIETLETEWADVVLTVALSCLELGREQWQQGQYENAAHSLESGRSLLLREGLFTSVRAEIQSDLYKLRPYRILELLALPEEEGAERSQGLDLLRDMLQERNGIDGTGNDQSGLSIDDFLRFIQQLRSYLNVAEQQTLFEEESRRPSAVATYLAVYALLARGFAQRQPALVRRAKAMLMRLGNRQDVHLEQAVCALLLGQTEEASRALELSHEYEPIAFIREHSQGAPDLLPGLCLYSERWLQDEVFPHFRNLANQKIALKDYFADEQVQAYLEELPSEGYASEWDSAPSQTRFYQQPPLEVAQELSTEPVWNSPPPERVPQAKTPWQRAPLPDPNLPNSDAATPEPSPMPAVRVSTTRSDSPQPPRSPKEQRRATPPPGKRPRSQPQLPMAGGRGKGDRSEPPRRNGGRSQRSGRGAGRQVPRVTPRLLAIVGAGILGLAGIGFLTTRTYGWLTQRSTSSPVLLQGDQVMVQLDQPPIEIPDPTRPASAIATNLTQETAAQVIQTWLSTKAEALGPNHTVEQLSQILVDPALAQWQKRAEEAKQEDWHWKYQHNLTVTAVKLDEADTNQAKVEAEVQEVAELFEQNQLNSEASYDETLQVQYDLVRQSGQWRIRTMTVL